MDSLAMAREVAQKFFSENVDPIPDNLAHNVDLERRIAAAIDEARLEEAKCGRNHCLTGMCNRERIAELEASLRERGKRR